MRLVIDLQACQNGAAADRNLVLAQALALAQHAGSHTVFIALSGRHASSLDALRQTFDGVVPDTRVLCYDTPAPDTPWQAHAARQLRLGFLAALNADAVYVPGVFDDPTAPTLADPVAGVLNVAGIGDAAGLLKAGALYPLLQQAALVLTADVDKAGALAAALPETRVVTVAATPEPAARQIWAMLESTLAGRAVTGMAAPAAASRLRLAYVSPLPPERSGIADYSAEVIRELEHYYDIELVMTPSPASTIDEAGGAPTPDSGLTRFPVRSAQWLMEHGDGYDRILYHFGNSGYHRHMFALLERHPGIVVLHDFYLTGALDRHEVDDRAPGVLLRALYDSHGHSGIRQYAERGRDAAVWTYPCNLPVLRQAVGVIVHSDFSKRLAERWYGPGAAEGWRTLPLLRGGAPADPAAFRAEARRKLDIAPDDYIVSAFGMLGATKLNDRLLDAFLASPLARDRHCRLVFVGENEALMYGADMARRIAQHAKKSPDAARINITGFVSATDYAYWLAASDNAVQLRGQTRGETSASVLDCLLHGVATIINANGALADVPADLVVKLDDEFATADLTAALVRLHDDSTARLSLGERARAFVAREHGPAQVGRLYYEAIEHFTQHGEKAHYRRMIGALTVPGAPRPPDEPALADVAGRIARNVPPRAPRQLLVDMSALVQADHKTGIQRVVRSVVLAMLKDPPPGFRVEPVYGDHGMHGYRYARSFTFGMLDGVRLDGGPLPAFEDAPVELAPGDIFLGLDLASSITAQNETTLLQMRRSGVQVWFVIYDLLPLLMPNMFPFGTSKYYLDYLKSVTLIADGIVTISSSVANELQEWLISRPNRRVKPLQIGYFHLGADIASSAPSRGLPRDAGQILAAVQAAPTLLMVGTVEPRKGHAQALSALELLWQRGVAVNLVIVGKAGWLVDALVKRLEPHPQSGKHLFWLQGVSDEMLTRLYENSAALLAASEGEGFGLPLIEAAQKGLPVIARDISVFREVAGEHAFYFSGTTPEELATSLETWLAMHNAGVAPQSDQMPWLTWQQSAAQLVDTVVHGRVHARVHGGDVAPQLLVDVSAIARNDLKTGIQRVVRAQLWEMLHLPTTRFQVNPVYLVDEGGRWHYRYARHYEHSLMGTGGPGIADTEVRVTAGDVFYAPDLFPGPVREAANAGVYAAWRAAGVSVNFLIYDLLPLLRPEFFPRQSEAEFRGWMCAISANADRLICISGAVADETRAWLQANLPNQPLPELAVTHLGADIDASFPSDGLPDDAPRVLADIAAAPSFLMVGTIEPRKGHLHALDAFEQLWAAGQDVCLVVVGGEGWKGLPDSERRTIPAIVARLATHPELGKRLHWLRGVSDQYLDAVYRASTCLLVPSEGEGFGLPLIEAARHGLPVMARDIPVFREVAGEHAHYFSGADGKALATEIEHWLTLHRAGTAKSSQDMPWQTWASNAQQLSKLLFGQVPPLSLANPT